MKVNEVVGDSVKNAVSQMKNGDIVMLENVRFNAGEKKNTPEFIQQLIDCIHPDVYVNDAFGTAHRAHASTVGVTSKIPVCLAGFLLEQELKFLYGAIDNPKRPLAAIVGGAKVSTKLPVLESLIDKCDKVLVGGGMMFTFLKAEGYDVKASRCEDEEFVNLAKELLAKANGKIVLPVDAVVNKAFEDVPGTAKAIDAFEDGDMGLDIGPKTLELFAKELAGAKTVVWNGPMGVFEMKNYAAGTIGVCELLAKLTAEGASTIIGGGDSAAAAEQLGYASKVSHISTGGGASLEYLEGKVLPGIACVNDK